MGRVADRGEARAVVEEARSADRKVVFTNGCFDLLHRGHVDLLRAARGMGDLLVVGLNSDASVKRLKGDDRPWVSEEDRAVIVGALETVDIVVLFDEDTPLELIRELVPDVLVKGSDYRPEDVVGADVVTAAGGKVELVSLTEGRSSTALFEKLRAGTKPDSK
jgi:D-beta-D-heptose 7-phosphate kinase/D-beta-D-heptose 1-phosphate adenosyltransferase